MCNILYYLVNTIFICDHILHYYGFKGSVHTWNKVGQIYLGHGQKQLLKHFGEMSINY